MVPVVVSFGKNKRLTGGKELKPKTKKNGYKELYLSISKNKAKSFYVHRLIAQTFIGSIPDGHNVNHIDGDKANNNVSNLEIITYSENSKHAYKHGLIKLNPQKGSEKSNSKTNEKEVLQIRTEHAKHRSLKKLISKYKHLSKGAITKIIYRETWKHV